MSRALRCDACGNYAHEGLREWFSISCGDAHSAFGIGRKQAWEVCSWACLGLLAVVAQEQEEAAA